MKQEQEHDYSDEQDEQTGTIINPEVSLNLSIVGRIHTIVKKMDHVNGQDRDILEKSRAYVLSGRTRRESSAFIHIYCGEVKEGDLSYVFTSEDLRGVPVDFNFPITAISCSSDSPRGNLVTTPYGVFTGGTIIGKDNLVYGFSNDYFFNQIGRALKKEQVGGGYNPEEEFDGILSYIGENLRRGAKRVNFIPNPDDSRCVELLGGDYEKLGQLLWRIENGYFTFPTWSGEKTFRI